MASPLEKISEQYRTELVNKNIYNTSKNYDNQHSNALSNGDDKGKGEFNGNVGSRTDIANRTDLVNKNTYSNKKNYPDFS
jgi:hypothetical protein